MDREVLQCILDRPPVNDDGRSGSALELVRRGVLDGLPPTVLHPAIDAWYDDGRGVLVTQDLGDAVLTWRSIVSSGRTGARERDHRGPARRAPRPAARGRGPAYDDEAMRRVRSPGSPGWGLNMALDIVEHPDPAVRERKRAALPWWLRQAELALETGLV